MNVFTQGNFSIVQTNEQFVIIDGERISKPLPYDPEIIRLLLEMIRSDETIPEIATRWVAENKSKQRYSDKEETVMNSIGQECAHDELIKVGKSRLICKKCMKTIEK